MIKKILFLFLLPSFLFANTNPSSDNNIEKKFEVIKSNPVQLETFLKDMPKGGDLHTHLTGATLAENLMAYGQGDSFCLDPTTLGAKINKACELEYTLENITNRPLLYQRIIDAWSMRNFQSQGNVKAGHDHFFATFAKFFPIASKHTGKILNEVVGRACQQNELYLELMVTPDDNASGLLGKKIGWDKNLSQLRKKLLSQGLPEIINQISKNITKDESELNNSCRIKIRYLYQILREQPPAQVFAQLLTGFEVVSKDPRFVGINMVQPEDGEISMRDYTLHMQMIKFLHQLYPTVKISLHAGELGPELVSGKGLTFHIQQAIEIANASRIGHGVSVKYEKNYLQLLKKMADKKILVEINLESNAAILGVKGNAHPILLYMKHQVPVALSTDDEGVIRTNLTNQYKLAVNQYPFNYKTLKNLSRNSLYYSFLAGKNLWVDDKYQKVVSYCKKDIIGSPKISKPCQNFLNQNEKAALQWELEKRFQAFENKIGQS